MDLKIPVWTDKQVLAEAERLQSVFPRVKLDLKNMDMEEIRRRTLLRRSEEKKKLRVQKGDQELIQRLKKYAKTTYATAKKDPERWAKYVEASRKSRASRIFGLVPVEFSGKGFLFRDLIANATMFQEGKLKNSHIKFKNPKQVQPTSIPQTQAIELIDINVLDKKGKPKVISYDNVEKHIDAHYANKKFGMSSKEVLNEYEKKRFIQQNPELRHQLNKKMYAAYESTDVNSRRFFSPFHIHHTAGRANNVFNVQLTTGSDNVREGSLRRAFNSDFKLAQTLSDKKAALKRYVDAVPENVEVRLKKVPYGQRAPLIEQLEKMAGKDIKLTPEVKAQATKLHSFPANLSEMAKMADPRKLPGDVAHLGRAAATKFPKTTAVLKSIFETRSTPGAVFWAAEAPLLLLQGTYDRYANERDFKKALKRMDLPDQVINQLGEVYGQELADIGQVGLESWAVDQPDTFETRKILTEQMAEKKPHFETRQAGPEMLKSFGQMTEGEREMEAQEEAARYEKFYPKAQRERFDRDQPMFAEGGIASLKKK